MCKVRQAAFSLSLWILRVGWQYCMAGNIQGSTRNNTLTVGYTTSWERGWIIGPTIGSAIIPGIKEIHRRGILPGYDIEWVFRDTYCEPRRGMQMAVDIWASVQDLDGIVGDGCSVVCQPVSLLAASWRIPFVSWGCSSASLSDKKIYPTFTRVESTWFSFAPILTALANEFNWTRLAIITTTQDVFKSMADQVNDHMVSHGKDILFRSIDTIMVGEKIDEKKKEILLETMIELKSKVRVFIILSYPRDLRNTLIAALDLGMMNGEYAFITLEYGIEIGIHTYRPELDPIIFDGLVAVGVRGPHPGPKYDDFRRDVIESFQHPAFAGLPHLPLDAGIEEVDVYAAYVHDAMLLWAYGVNKSLEQGFGPDDGYKITENIINMTFEGMSGTVLIDEKGDRNQDHRIIILQGYTPVTLMHWIAAESMMKKVYKADIPGDWSGIHWSGNGTEVPEDSPLCGWKGELCSTNESSNQLTVIILAVTGCLVVVIVVVTSVLVRKYRLQLELKQIKEIQIAWANLQNVKELVDSDDGENESPYKIAKLENENVMIKAVKQKTGSINLQDRSLLAGVIVLKQLSHENVVSFVGICVEPLHESVIMKYAQRGNLSQIILEEGKKLSLDFKLSFLFDIASGMRYIHQSPLKVHGNLNISKCVVDGRWVCKVTGYERAVLWDSLGALHTPSEPNHEKNLWVAPELLRKGNQMYTKGTQKGDVYSFAMVTSVVIMEKSLTELMTNNSDSSLEDVVNKIKCQDAPFRPRIYEEACPDEWLLLITNCWDENPAKRHDFKSILQNLIKLNKNKRLELVDNMIKLLESHTEILEKEVAERTSELQVEKGKMEKILCELLPQTVAESLKHGSQVPPESFEIVTVFFSDIVGFTRISAEGTPLDIVLLLNKMYTLFDDVASVFDVYKVATIGDAYMVASGVPLRNGDRHAHAICNMALALLEAIEAFPIPHIPNEYLRMRVGIHSGSCVAGVVGVKMPRYLLFGDTVDTAAKMESGGEAMRIHTSSATWKILKNNHEFEFNTRGIISISGREMKTYWLSRMKSQS